MKIYQNHNFSNWDYILTLKEANYMNHAMIDYIDKLERKKGDATT